MVVAARLDAAAGASGSRDSQRSAALLEAVRGKDDADIIECREAGFGVLLL